MKSLKHNLGLVFYLLFIVDVFGQASVNGKAAQLRKMLIPYFIPVERDSNFIKQNATKIALGKQLFYDEKLSLDKGTSCNSCHDLKKYGTNGNYYLTQKREGEFYRDIPSIYNSSGYELFNVDGGLSEYSEKIKEAFLSTYEMGVNEIKVINYLKKNAFYQQEFKKVFPKNNKPVNLNNVVEVLQAFMSELKTPALIDKFIKGDNKALTSVQIQGGELFINKACYSCHTGSNFGGQMINKLGVEEPWPNQTDLGFYYIKKQAAYKMFFRVAPLRNVEKTAPYFHDASSVKLDKAIKLMGIHERGIQLRVTEIAKIKEFLKSFTGDIPESYIKNK